MIAFSIEQKYQGCRVIMIISLAVALYCLRQLSAFSSYHHNISWFVAFLAALVLAIISCLGFYYYRGKRQDKDVNAIAMQALNDYGKRTHDENK